MPWSNNSGGPWGGGPSGGGGKNPWGGGPGGRGGRGGGGGGEEPPNLDELFKQSQERLRTVLGGGNGGGGGRGGSGGPSTKIMIGAGVAAALAIWVFASVFQVEQNEKAVVLTFGEFSETKGPGLNFAFWPVQTHQKVQVTNERTVDIGLESVAAARGRNPRRDDGLMLTGDENVVDVSFQIVWNIDNPADYLFNLALPNETIEAVSEASIREVVGRSEIEPVLKRDGILTQQVETLIQSTLDGYEAGVNIVRVNFVAVAPPEPVVESFDNVTKATQRQEQLQLDADGYKRQKLADARGEAAQILENAQGYSARVVKEAEGEAARFDAIREEYEKAPLVTRKRLYLETMEKVLGDVDKIILDDTSGAGGGGVVPYLPLNELSKRGAAQ